MSQTQKITFHVLLDVYAEDIYFNKPSSEQARRNRVQIVKCLKEAHPDRTLQELDCNQIQSMIDHWRYRAKSNKTGRSISKTTARDRISELQCFLGWLHDRSAIDWSLPSDVFRLKTTPKTIDEDYRTKVLCQRSFSIGELEQLYKHSQGTARLMLLLGLNCGFGAAEMGKLRFEDVHLGDNSSNDTLEAFVTYTRPTSSHRGLWPLWPETIRSLTIVIGERIESGGFVFQAHSGESLYRPDSPNPASKFFNHWRRLILEVQKNHLDFPAFPLGSLRSTVADLLLKHCPNEVVRAFLGHVPEDLASMYVRHDGGHLESIACKRLREILSPVFQAE